VRVPFTWLREYCDPGLPVGEVAELLAMRSTEVERISIVGPPSPTGFVVGRVIEVQAHPGADRLSVCRVDTGDEERTIVCGAPNVAPGQTVPVALPGAVMPGGERLGTAKLRGVASEGMILSEAELELGDDGSGIVVLDDARPFTDPVAPGRIRAEPGSPVAAAPWAEAAGLTPGLPLAQVLPLSEAVLELEVHSNRVDCLGVYGVAREVHAITGAELAEPPWTRDADARGEGGVSDYASVTVKVPDLCPRFTARTFTDVTIGPSPLWLKARLVAAGQRPINNLVDITNYVMLITAQPLHAYDLDRVPGGALTIRTARGDERITTLDGVERRLDRDAVVVCDRDGPSGGIAGIMGGERSEVSAATTRVLLEAATWNGVNILRTSRRLGLRSDASTRFEKQLHPELAVRAQRIASRLLVGLCGARLVPGTIDAAAEPPPARRVRLRAGRAERLLGMTVEADRSARYLDRLGFEVEHEDGDLVAEVPVHRYFDVTREADLIEEVGRIHGYDEHLPATLPAGAGEGGRLSREQVLRRRAEDLMRDLGFDALVSLSLTDPAVPERLRLAEGDPRREPIGISNPLSLEHSVLRTTLLGSLLEAARYNVARGAERVAVFESARAYLREGGPAGGALGGEFVGERPAPAFEPHRIGCLAIGPLGESSWRDRGREADFFAIKGVLEALARGLGAELAVEQVDEPFLHPGRSARVTVGGSSAGWVGEVHPLVCRAWDLQGAAAFEIDLAALIGSSTYGTERYADVISYPAVHQDIAVVVADAVPVAEIASAIQAGGGELLRSARVFDLYRGDQVGEGRKSIALRLEFRAPDRTLTDEEVARRREAIRVALAEIGGSLRE
jgi:phenylalanyl-tRNA synthetase beta chain